MSSPLDNGIAVIHSNQLEQLRDVVEYWLRQHPLAPLENEVFLVQSNGMGQWLKQHLAKNSALGIAAAIQMQLPSLFVWSVYRAVLGEEIPKHQALAKAPLTWRLYRLLPAVLDQNGFETLKSFLADDLGSRKRHQLAEQLADLFDQYQVYRSDWLGDWAAGHDRLRDARGEIQPLPAAQCWQAALWRIVLADLGDNAGEDAARFASRAAVHAQFMARIDALELRPAGLPRRIMLFGLSSLPQQTLEAIAKLGKFCQIVLFVHNPCRHYWADIIEDKELLRAERRRQAYKAGMHPALSAEELHLCAPPLLAAWGKQGRDYIRLLDLFDEKQGYQDWHWPDDKIDLFQDYGQPGQRTLLQRVQQALLDLEPPPARPEPLADIDDSIVFHIAHSPQREVEILHDRLLACFEEARRRGDPLHPRDVIVMVPDIDAYAPHVRAVFGLHAPEDPRHIPYNLADQQQRGQHPLLLAVETLLNLPESRFSVSEYLGLLEVGALRARFEIEEAAVGKLHQWIEDAGIRWGLNAEQRAAAVAMPAHLDANTWQFGLRRMLLGYAVGDGVAFNGIEPYEEIGGLDAEWLGGLAGLLETLETYAAHLQRQQSFSDWQQTLQQMLADFFSPGNDAELKMLDTLNVALASWSEQCALAGLAGDLLPIAVVREAWLAGVDEPSLQQRFLGGRVNFCTLMPMRAIPFRHICLLGMNDGDYPRNQQPHSFDLMSQRGHYRPGDRSRRQDDQYLFLEALLSARRQLYISWVGRSIRDNSERPPSVLVSQLREVLAQSWAPADGGPLLPAITLRHPLQPFSLDYVAQDRDPRLFTYAREWFESASETAVSAPAVAAEAKRLNLSLDALARFLSAPVRTFCQQTLKFGFEIDASTGEDSEPFRFDALQTHLLSQQLANGLQNAPPDSVDDYLATQQGALARKGQLPLGAFADAAYARLTEPVKSAWRGYQNLLADWPDALDAHALDLPAFAMVNGDTVQLTGELTRLRQDPQGQNKALPHLCAGALRPSSGIKYSKLFPYWLRHLAACAEGLSIESFIAASDGVLHIAPVAPEQARAHLETLIDAYLQALCGPLPLACKSAFVWLATTPEQDPDLKAQAAYEGDEWNNGEVDYDPYLMRFFPTFAELTADQDRGFAFWAERLYRPLVELIKPHSPA